jgi:hypothetical protein
MAERPVAFNDLMMDFLAESGRADQAASPTQVA